MKMEEETTLPPRKKTRHKNVPLSVGFTILFHPDIRRIGEVSILTKFNENRTFKLSRLTPIFGPPVISGTHIERKPLASPFVSRDAIDFSIKADKWLVMRNPHGKSLSANGEPVDDQRVFDEKDLKRGVVLLLSDAVVVLLHFLNPPIVTTVDKPWRSLNIVGHDWQMEMLRVNILKVAPLDIPVLIRGETGTGKELVASAIFANSNRTGTATTLNCAAIQPTLAERELFGAEPGAATGEDGTLGYFREADKGTLFLDEIGDLNPDIQAKLLRALESGEIQTLGSAKPKKVDVRVISGTDVDLEAATREGRFRDSLLQRLSAYAIHIPPLRKRRADIGRLFIHFLKTTLEKNGESNKLSPPEPHEHPWLPAGFVAKLALYSWRGNVRELKHFAGEVTTNNLGCRDFQGACFALIEKKLSEDNRPQETVPKNEHRQSPTVKPLSYDEIVAALKRNGYNIMRAAQEVRFDAATFRRRLASFDIDVDTLILEELKRNRMDLFRTAASLEVPPADLRQTIKRRGQPFDELIVDKLQQLRMTPETSADVMSRIKALFELRGLDINMCAVKK